MENEERQEPLRRPVAPDSPEDGINEISPSLPVPDQNILPDMEVHHHGHVHETRKWKEYLFQFLMLFLAVTLGFFVENQREHYIERYRAKQFARLLVSDLQADLAELSRAERVLGKIVQAGDSLGKLLSGDIRSVPTGKLYYYEYWSGWRWNVISRDVTLQQLKHSGSLRYFEDKSLIRKILDYEESIRIIYMLQNKYEPEKTENWNLVQKVFNQTYFNRLDAMPVASRDSTAKSFNLEDPELVQFINSDLPVNNVNQNTWFELRNWAYNSSRNYRVIIHDIGSARATAESCINGLKKEYGFE